ncbi:MAG: hypothetical protein JO112_20415 [Planctomycetes bacterium]|nr:hypothetical protein [Planctomycetota bacterium]
MNKRERVDAVLAGQTPDRPPLSFWHHFGPDEGFGPRAVEAHLRFLETYDLDFLKIMDDNRYPRTFNRQGLLASVEDFAALSVLRGDEDTFGRQLELIGELARRLDGQVRMPTTLFNSWSTLRHLAAPEPRHHGPPPPTAPPHPGDALLARAFQEAPAALARALDVIAESLANFARKAVTAGADGVFLSVRDDWVDTPENGPGTYARLVQPGDDTILAGSAGGTFNILHVCGQALDFQRFAGYPVQALNWADRQAGPAIREIAGWLRPALCAGLDHRDTLARGSPDDCLRELHDAIAQAGGRPLMIAPGCTFDPEVVPPENLHALRRKG